VEHGYHLGKATFRTLRNELDAWWVYQQCYSCYFVRWYWKRAWLGPQYQKVTGNQQIHQTDLHNTYNCAFTPVGIRVSFRGSMTQKPLSTVYYVCNSSCFRRHINTLFSRLSRLLT